MELLYATTRYRALLLATIRYYSLLLLLLALLLATTSYMLLLAATATATATATTRYYILLLLLTHPNRWVPIYTTRGRGPRGCVHPLGGVGCDMACETAVRRLL